MEQQFGVRLYELNVNVKKSTHICASLCEHFHWWRVYDIIQHGNAFLLQPSSCYKSTYGLKNGRCPHSHLLVTQRTLLSPSITTTATWDAQKSIRITCNFGRSIHQSHFNTRTSHQEHAVVIYLIKLTLVPQSNGLSITSAHPKQHFGEVWEVYSSKIEG